MIGKEEYIPSPDPTYTVTPATPTDPMSGGLNVGDIRVNGAVLSSAFIQQFDLVVDPNLRPVSAVGQGGRNVAINYGKFKVSGTLAALLSDNELALLRDAHTYVEIAIPVVDAAGNGFVFTIPNAVFADGEAEVTGTGTDLVQPLAFSARAPVGASYTVQLDIA